jgi:hypothetical protein
VAVPFFAAACFAAADPQIGTWKLNEAKSKLSPGAPKNHTVVYTAVGDKVKVTVDGTSSDGKAVHSEWTGSFDGKPYAVTGGPEDTRTYTKVNDRTLKFTGKKGTTTVMSGEVVVSADGKTRTVTVSGTDAAGKKYTATGVYDRK